MDGLNLDLLEYGLVPNGHNNLKDKFLSKKCICDGLIKLGFADYAPCYCKCKGCVRRTKCIYVVSGYLCKDCKIGGGKDD